VRRLSERYGWPVTLDSAPGQGTTATLRFPAPGLADDLLSELRP
jgi:signal transduction histidine kinase